jgi:TRAP-type C4-dicarboxylate transport system substrate-binding protein
MSAKGIASMIVTAVLLSGVPAPKRAGAQAKPIRIKLGTSAPAGTPPYQALQVMADKWRKAPAGGVDLIPSNPKGSEDKLVSKLLIGELQGVLVSVTGLSKIDDSAKALEDLPFMFRSLDEVEYVRKKLTPEIEKKFLDKGYVVLFWGDIGWVRFFSKEPMIHPADLKKMKIFTWAGDPSQANIMTAAGFNPVPLDTDFILTSLQTGLINVVPTAPLIANVGQFDSQTRHMLEINYAPLVGGAVITRKAWNSIPKAAQDALRISAQEAGIAFTKNSRAQNDQMVTTMKKKSALIVHAVTPEIEAEWRDLAKSIYPKIRGSIVPADMFDRVTALLDEYRAANSSGTSKPLAGLAK